VTLGEKQARQYRIRNPFHDQRVSQYARIATDFLDNMIDEPPNGCCFSHKRHVGVEFDTA
jgi:hypothetical protein